MAINLTTLFTQIGSIGGILAQCNIVQADLATYVENYISQYTPAEEGLYDGIDPALTSQQQAELGLMSFLQQSAINTINTTVFNNQPLQNNTSLALSIQNILQSMQAQSATIKECTIGSSVTPNLTNGNGVCVVGLMTNLGLSCQYTIPEIVTVACSQDATSGQVPFNEAFTAVGQMAAPNVLSFNYPIGSGANVTLNAIDGQTSGGSGNLLSDSDFQTSATLANVPDNWHVVTGTPGTTIFVSNTTPYVGTNSLKFVGTGSEQTAIRQEFGTDNFSTLTNITQYAVNFYCRLSSSSTTGVISVSLVDSSNAVLQDFSGNNCTISAPVSGFNTSTYTPVSGVFNTPYILPGNVYIKIEMSTALANTIGLLIADMAMGVPTQLYPLGPSVAVFSGSSQFYIPDNYAATTSNNFGTASNLATFSQLFQRLFNMSSIGIILPYAGSPTINDVLIST